MINFQNTENTSTVYALIKYSPPMCDRAWEQYSYNVIHVLHCFTHVVAACMKHWACMMPASGQSYPDMQLGGHNTYLLDPSGRRAHTCTQSCIIIMAIWHAENWFAGSYIEQLPSMACIDIDPSSTIRWWRIWFRRKEWRGRLPHRRYTTCVCVHIRVQ